MNEISKKDLKEIREHIKKADRLIIANNTGLSQSYIYKVLQGKLYNRKIIIEALRITVERKNEWRQLKEGLKTSKTISNE